MAETPQTPAATHKHKFRYLLPPGNNFAFVAKFRIWIIISVLLMSVAIGSLFVNKSVRGEYMNWTIDFKGGTEIIFAFRDATKAPTFDHLRDQLAKAQSDAERTDLKQKIDALGPEFVKVDPGKVREALARSGEDALDVSDFSWEAANRHNIDGMVVRSPRFSALKPESEVKALDDFVARFKAKGIEKATWSGDRLRVDG